MFAMFFGALIGWERQTKDKSAGIRTYILVSLGSALFILIPILLNIDNQDTNSISRAVQGIATGIGFLGAGEIWRDTQATIKKTPIHGLTSAAAIWVAAGLGIAAGCGLWQLGLIGTSLVLVVLRLIKKFEHYL
jgi:putative Mg2+ transporter-C (MgtC) family protein